MMVVMVMVMSSVSGRRGVVAVVVQCGNWVDGWEESMNGLHRHSR